jgi:hypothetical protein
MKSENSRDFFGGIHFVYFVCFVVATNCMVPAEAGSGS